MREDVFRDRIEKGFAKGNFVHTNSHMRVLQEQMQVMDLGCRSGSRDVGTEVV